MRTLTAMRVLAGIAGVVLIFLMLSEFFVSFMLPRRVKRDPRIARGLNRLLWRPWRALARQFQPSTADTLLGFFGPLALIVQLVVWAIGLVIGYGLLEWAVAGGSFNDRFLSSSGLFLSAGGEGGGTGVRVVQLLEAATGVGVLFIVIGYMPSVYSAFSRRETAVSQLATRGGSPPAAGTLLHRAAGRERWRDLERDLRSWEEWAAELMETHLSYPLLGFYRSQHVGQNWLAALTAMVDVAAFVKATTPDVDGADITYRTRSPTWRTSTRWSRPRSTASPTRSSTTCSRSSSARPWRTSTARPRVGISTTCVRSTSRTRRRSPTSWRSSCRRGSGAAT
jgi:hypothetical protein